MRKPMTTSQRFTRSQMMKRIEIPLVSPNKSLGEAFTEMFGKYTSWDNFVDEARNLAEDDIQSDIIDELMDEIQCNNLITTNSPLEIELYTDNLREWLQMYYRLEKK